MKFYDMSSTFLDVYLFIEPGPGCISLSTISIENIDKKKVLSFFNAGQTGQWIGLNKVGATLKMKKNDAINIKSDSLYSICSTILFYDAPDKENGAMTVYAHKVALTKVKIFLLGCEPFNDEIGYLSLKVLISINKNVPFGNERIVEDEE